MSQFPNIVIRASAGTGKTFQLSNRFLSLLDSGASADQILATTFTRKAAGEILDRVMIRLAEASIDEEACRKLGGFIDNEDLSRERCLELLTHLTSRLHRLRICTLDALFSQMASSFSLELGLPPGWHIIEGIHDAQLRSEAIESILQGDSNNDVQRLMHLLTKGEADRSVSELVRSTVRRLYSLYCETNKEAWNRFPDCKPLTPETLSRTMDDLSRLPIVSDKRIERAHAASIEAAMAGDWELFISKGMAAKVLVGETTYQKKPIPPNAMMVYQKLVRHARGVLVSQLAHQTAATHELLERFDRVYRELKLDARALLFDDITRYLSQFATADVIEHQHFRLDAQLSHLLLDEFQDTSLAQWQILRPLARRITKTESQQSFLWAGGQESFFCVGDVKQAIYGWRGGRSEIFDALEAHLVGLEHELLNESYRSAQPVIDTVNDVFTHMTNHPKLEYLAEPIGNWSKKFKEHTTARNELHGFTELRTAPEADDFDDQDAVTLRFAAEQIAEIVERCPGRSIGVLARKNAVVAQLIFELRKLGVPASEEGGNPLTDSVAVQLILSLLKMADHPGDLVARFHVAESPLGRVVGFTQHDDEAAAFEVAQRTRRDLLSDGYGPTIYSLAQDLAPSCNRRDRNRLQQLVELAFGYQSIATLRATDFLDFVASEKIADPTSAPVRVITIHKAKGLQYDIVVLPDLDDKLIGQPGACVSGQSDPTEPVDRVSLYRNVEIQNLLPPEFQQLFIDATNESITESLCVLYVSLTRAIHALHMIVSPSKRNERNLHKTPAGLIRAALTDGDRLAPEFVAYQHGDPEWFAKEPPVERAAPKKVREIDEIQLAPAATRRVTGLEYTTPSGLEGGSHVRADQILGLESSVALARGTLIHAWFEQIVWLDHGPPAEALLREVSSTLDTLDLDIDEQLSWFYDRLKLPQISAAMQSNYYRGMPAEVHNERRFTVVENGQMLNGTIDRLVLLRDGSNIVAADILDFKTDAVDPNSSDWPTVVDYYRPQIDAYRGAVSKMFHLPLSAITAKLLFVSPGIVQDMSPQGRATVA